MTTPADGCEAFVHELVRGLMYAQVYGPGHARLRESADTAAVRVADLVKESGGESVLLCAIGEQVVFQGRPVLGTYAFVKRLVQNFSARGVGGVEFRRDVDGDDLLALLRFLANRGSPSGVAECNAEIHAAGASALTFLPPYAEEEGTGGVDLPGVEGEQDWVLALNRDAVDLLQGVTISACLGREIDLADVRGCVEGILAGLARDAVAVLSAARYPQYDLYTLGHSIRVCMLALDVARAWVHDPELQARIGMAALLHDVGKALISVEVLHKPGKLTPEERREMQRHPVLGAGLLLSNRQSDPVSVAAAYGHHVTADGGGYPRTCDEFEASFVTRLVKVCDAYEALTAERPYKPALPSERALRIMVAMKGHFDPKILRLFIRHIGVYPLGSWVRLDRGEVAQVVAQTADPLRPMTEILDPAVGTRSSRARQRYDLSRPVAGGPTRVVDTLDAPPGTAVA